jgi:hypothetical protein
MAKTKPIRDIFLKEAVMSVKRIGLESAKLRVHSLTPDEYKVKIKKL